MNKIGHLPNLKTVLLVEETIKLNSPLSKSDLVRLLPVKIMNSTLNNVLEYLKKESKIYFDGKDIELISDKDVELRSQIKSFVQLSECVNSFLKSIGDSDHVPKESVDLMMKSLASHPFMNSRNNVNKTSKFKELKKKVQEIESKKLQVDVIK